MSVVEIIIISIGLSLDVFVAVAYLGAGFSRVDKKNLAGLSLLFGGVQCGCLMVGNLLTLLPFFTGAHSTQAANRWENLTALIFAGLGFYMVSKGIKHETVLERRKDTIEWKTTVVLAFVTSVDAFFAGIGLGFLDAEMILQSLTLFPITIGAVILGIYAGYMAGLRHNRQAYWASGALFLIAGVDVIIQYCI